jgi:hypothetical protein
MLAPLSSTKSSAPQYFVNFLIPVIAGHQEDGSMEKEKRIKKKVHGYIYSPAYLDLMEFQAFVRHSADFPAHFVQVSIYYSILG